MKQTRLADLLDESVIHKLFKTEAKKIWGKSVVDQLNIKVRIGEGISKKTSPASLEMPRSITPRAVGKTLLRTSKKMTLQIHPKTLREPRKKIRDTLRHEAIHIGHFKHDKGFRSLAEELGVSLTYGFGGAIKIKEQRIKGSRFKVVATAKTEDEAKKIAHKFMDKNRSKGYRYMLEW